MRNVFLFMMVTLDGYFEGPNQDIGWHNVDEEFNEFAIQQLDEIGMLLFGRVTYEVMASYWPTQFALDDDPAVAEKMNSYAQDCFFKNTGEGRMEEYKAGERKYCRGSFEAEATRGPRPGNIR